ncbi:hypothetical protein K2173_003641 [Erythroxylum novogranatense]|uniref:Uncharacterized protein n=1 Tax=Erythroxylum novogranatense TaxID=1862640 RepID=A0AAV8TCX6_9ROSI|nr:hypothetical protein K2173_003641 [Erythroxylum novogranatense]
MDFITHWMGEVYDCDEIEQLIVQFIDRHMETMVKHITARFNEVLENLNILGHLRNPIQTDVDDDFGNGEDDEYFDELETEEQLVARYIGGIRMQIQDTVNMLDPVFILVTHQRALMVEKQLQHINFGIVRSVSDGGGNNSGVGSSNSGNHAGISGFVDNPTRFNKPGISGIRCFSYGEMGHKKEDCKKARKRALFIDNDEGDDEEGMYVGEKLAFDTDVVDEEIVTRDVGTTLVIRR